jgi:hypothetical protein
VLINFIPEARGIGAEVVKLRISKLKKSMFQQLPDQLAS